MGILLLCTGVAFVITVLLKHYFPRFAGWSFGWLMVATGVLTLVGFAVMVSTWAAFR